MADENTRINALSGGAPLPQADTQTIARRLLGPGIADRYGDVLGTRPTGIADIARDFSLGMVSGDPSKADMVKAQVAKSYNDELRKADDQRMQQEEAARAQMQGVFSLFKNLKDVKPDLRKDFMKEGLTKYGFEATSPFFLKMVSDFEKYPDAYAAFTSPEIQDLADEKPFDAVEQLTQMTHDPEASTQVVKNFLEMKRYRAQTSKIMAGIGQKQARTPQDPVAKARLAFIGRIAGKQIRDEATGEPRTVSPAEAVSMADQLYGGGPKPAGAGIPQSAPIATPADRLPPDSPALTGPAGDLTTTTTTTTAPTETSTPAAAPAAAPVGIPQARGNSGVKIKKITQVPKAQ